MITLSIIYKKQIFRKKILINILGRDFLPDKELCGNKKANECPKNYAKKIKVYGKQCSAIIGDISHC